MADQKLGRAVLEIVIDDKQYKFALNEVRKNADDTAKNVKSISDAVNLAVWREFATIAGGAVKAVLGGIIELGQHGADVDDVASSFGTLAAKTGETADTMLGELRKGVVGSLSDLELMTLANKALGAGLIKNSGDMGTLAAGARALAKATGGTTKEAFDTLTSAIASGRTAQLKQLGLFVDSKVAVENWASAHGKTVAQMTDANRAQALSAASLAALKNRLKEIVPDAADFGEIIARAKAQVANFTDALSVGVAKSPVLKAGMDALSTAFTSAFGAGNQDLISTTVHLIEDIASWLITGAKIGVEFARVLINAFFGVKAAFNAYLEIVTSGMGKLAGFLATMAEQAAKLPVVGEAYAKLGAGLRQVSDFANSLAFGFGQVKESAIDSAGTAGAVLDKVSGTLTAMDDAMTAARARSAQGATEAGKAIAGLGQNGAEASTRTAEATKAIAESYRKLNEEVVLGTKVGLDKRMAELAFARDKEIADVKALTGITATEVAAQVALIQQKYQQQVSAAQLGNDEIRTLEQTLQQDLATLTTTGTEQKLLTIEFARQKELQSLAFLKANYMAQYTELAALVNQKYQLMTDAANGHFTSVVAAAAAAGFQTKSEMQKTADEAKRLWEEMKASGLFTAKQIQEAWERAEKAKRAAKGETVKYTMTSDQALMQGASQLFQVLGAKYKAAAIAGAVIATYQAVAKALASAPWPANLVLAAGALAAGLANVQKIRSSSEGFKEGTPGLDFAGFGREFPTVLHGNEAVIPQGRGHLLAGEIAAAMSKDGGGNSNVGMDRLLKAVEDLPGNVRRAMISGMQFAQR